MISNNKYTSVLPTYRDGGACDIHPSRVCYFYSRHWHACIHVSAYPSRVLRDSVQGRSYFPYGRKGSYICACAVTPYDTLKGKNSVKSVYYVTKYTSCNLAVFESPHLFRGIWHVTVGMTSPPLTANVQAIVSKVRDAMRRGSLVSRGSLLS